MRFVTQSESEPFFLKLGISRSGLVPGSHSAIRLKTFDAYYQSRLSVAAQVADALATHQGNFTACLLWAHDLVWGDRSLEERPPSDWAEYRRWRQTRGEKRSLRDAPGHFFDNGERDTLASVIEWAIHMGWDTLIAAKPNKAAIHLSHDDRITIYARSRPSELIARLTALGLKPTQRSL
ncbi:hypothetical protein [Bradyrhizobium sp. 170]|uniref:hypothetical protein n=1 Tax=Bradyrhizobium sp. 170 TaxID=2782641 RepID=UPI001FFF00F3|nr:hypothetical protein [Bradyrhizobium sp. 170]UPK07611.1 hypothetical protein IVB05_20125 [Bradyrhizobium sp. 170]